VVEGLRERKKLETWHTLRSAALRLFADHGFDSVSVDDIAAEANVSKRTFFNYFESKEAVIFDPDPEEPDRWQEIIDGRPADEEVWTALTGFFDAYFASHETKLPVLKRLVVASPSLAAASRATSDALTTFVAAWVRTRVRKDFDAAVITAAAFGVINTAFAAWDPDTGISDLQRLVRSGFAVIAKHATR